MVIFVGLGNPGSTYQNTRHNIGFRLIDFLVHKGQFKPANGKKFSAEVFTQPNLILVKPQTFMNNSGMATQAVWHFYNKGQEQSNFSNLFVIHDDLDIEFGSYKIQLGKGPKVHNGLLSLYQHLKTTQFWHVRIGVDNRQGDRTLPGQAYVLQNFTTSEEQLLQPLLEEISDKLLGLIKE